jgi:geranylgeranyl pyrophosphate synthase
MAEAASFMAEIGELVDRSLDDLLPRTDESPLRLHEAIRWSIFAGGKRVRPAILFAVGRTFDADDEKLLRTASAIEMIHTYSLIHDDLPAMDDDDLRRGRESCHKRFDEATAILAGDVLQTLAFKAIAYDARLPFDVRVRLIQLLSDAAGTPGGMAAGQQLDLEAEGNEVPIDEIRRIHEMKTGSLICASALSGAIIAGANESDLDHVRIFGDKLGLLYQITDDILDATQSTQTLGKTAGKDAASAKATFASYYGIDAASALAAELLDEVSAAIDPLSGDTSLLRGLAELIAKRLS